MGLGHLLCARPHTRPSTFIISFTPLSRPRDFPGGSDSKKSICNVGDPGLIPGSGRFPRRKERLPSNFVDREPWWATVCGVMKSGYN